MESRKGHRTFDPGRQKAREEADALMKAPPVALAAWADKQGVPLTAPENVLIWAHVERELRRMGVLDLAKIWVQEQILELQDSKVSARSKTCKEICYRVVRQVFAGGKYAGMYKPHADDDGEQDCLPKDLRWVYNHPLLEKGADENDPVTQALVAHYERQNKAPSQGARNRLRRCLDSEKATDTMFKEVNEIMLTHRKKPLTPVTEAAAPEATKEELAILDLDEELAKMAQSVE